jgi:hypothetical protein
VESAATFPKFTAPEITTVLALELVTVPSTLVAADPELIALVV